MADALWRLPKIDEAFRRGDLSYSKVRALTRVAGDVTEGDLVAFALKSVSVAVRGVLRRLRNGDPVVSAADAQRLHEARSLIRHFREDGSASMTVELPRESLELVLAALERVGARLPEDPSRSLFARAADALVMMARESLAGETGASSSAEGHQVVVHVDARALSGEGGESDLPVPTVEASVLPQCRSIGARTGRAERQGAGRRPRAARGAHGPQTRAAGP
ncbi:MAG: DUF222 domain-containing protein [Gammaproteobacteria bacterium]|nr:DUF222 domain-containing protein [Gammaproteobacteria bacterium]